MEIIRTTFIHSIYHFTLYRFTLHLSEQVFLKKIFLLSGNVLVNSSGTQPAFLPFQISYYISCTCLNTIMYRSQRYNFFENQWNIIIIDVKLFSITLFRVVFKKWNSDKIIYVICIRWYSLGEYGRTPLLQYP